MNAPCPPEIATPMDAEAAAKDAFFERIATLSEEMITAFGPDFAMGALVLAARFIASKNTPAAPETPAPQIITQP